MNRFLITSALGVLLITSLPAVASFTIVEDLKNLHVAMEQLEEAKRQVTGMKDQINQIKSLEGKMTGQHHYGKDMIQQLGQLRSSVNQLSPTLSGLIFPAGSTGTNMKDIQSMVDNVFVPDDNLPKEVTLPQRQVYWQKSLKSSIQNSERIMNDAGRSIDRIEKLAHQIDQTKTVKEAQDLTNRLISESLLIQQEILVLLSQLARAQASARYVGIANNAMAKQARSKTEEVKDYMGDYSKHPLPTYNEEEIMNNPVGKRLLNNLEGNG